MPITAQTGESLEQRNDDAATDNTAHADYPRGGSTDWFPPDNGGTGS